MRIFFKLCFLGFIGFCFLQCGASKNVTKKKIVDKQDLIIAYEQTFVDYSMLEIKNKIQYEGSMSMGLDGVFRLNKGKEIWISLKKFGFEAARIKITQDSFFLLNRLQRSYIKKDIASFKDVSGVPLTFADLEQALIGGAILMDGYTQNSDSTIQKSETVQSQIYDIIHTFDPSKRQLQETKVSDRTGTNEMLISYDEFNMVEDRVLPFFRFIKIRLPKELISITLQTSEIQFNAKKSFPFEIPSHYNPM